MNGTSLSLVRGDKLKVVYVDNYVHTQKFFFDEEGVM
jgi:hypothetical protein